MTSTADPRPQPLPPVTCFPWCCWQDGHPGQRHIEDQWCGTLEVAVDLSLYPEIEDHHDTTPDATSAYVHGPDQIAVYGAASPTEAPHVLIEHAERPSFGWFALRLTPAEAEQLVEAVQLVLGQIGAAR